VLQGTIRGFGEDQCTIRAASLAYYGLLSLFPLLLFLVFLGSQVLRSSSTRSVLDEYVANTLPAAADTVQAVIDQTLQRRGQIGLIGGLGLLWSSSALFNVLSVSLNVIWGASFRPAWRRRLVAALSVLIIGVLFLLSILLSALAALPFPGQGLGLWPGVNLSLGMLVTVLLFWVLYHAIPNRQVKWQAALSGAILSALLWQGAKAAFTWYLASGLSNYGAVYGSLASVIGLLLWAYFSAQILFLGAEFAVSVEREFWPNAQDKKANLERGSGGGAGG
jgi:membrane protein